MPYIGAGIQKFNTADSLTVNGDAEITGTVNPSGDTASGDAAAVGFTSTEGLILTGQGSTSDITVKNDADATVFTVPTGTDDILFPDNAKAIFGAGSDLKIYHDGSNSYVEDAGSGYLVLKGSDPGIALQNSSAANLLLTGTNDVSLLFSGNAKLATTNTGVDITGGFTATDGCTITTADNDAQLTLTSTDADGVVGPVLVMNRDSSSPAIGDSLGQILYKFDNESAESTEAIRINAILSDSTDGSEDARLQIEQMFGGSMFSFLEMSKDGIVFNENSQNIDFRVESDGNTNMLIVDAGNNSVMVGDNTGASYSDGGLFVRHAGGANNSPLCVVNGTTSGTRRMVDFFVGTGTSRVGSIQSNDSATAFNTSSDYRLKENVADMTGAIDRVKALAPKRFNFIVSPDTIVDGFLAHEVSSIVPEAISGVKDEVATWGKEEKLPDGVKVGDNKLDDDGNTIPIMQGIDHSKLVPLLTAALKEAVAKIESLEARVTTLEGE